MVKRRSSRSKTGRYVDWAGIVARGRENPGRWVLELPDSPAATLKSVRDRRHPDLRVEDGRLEGMILNEHVGPDRRKRGDIYTRFVVKSQGINGHNAP